MAQKGSNKSIMMERRNTAQTSQRNVKNGSFFKFEFKSDHTQQVKHSNKNSEGSSDSHSNVSENCSPGNKDTVAKDSNANTPNLLNQTSIYKMDNPINKAETLAITPTPNPTIKVTESADVLREKQKCVWSEIKEWNSQYMNFVKSKPNPLISKFSTVYERDTNTRIVKYQTCDYANKPTSIKKGNYQNMEEFKPNFACYDYRVAILFRMCL